MKTTNKALSTPAVISLVLGFISFFPGIGLFIGIVGVLLGIIGLLDVKQKSLRGKKFAIAGIVLSILGIGLTVVLYASLFYFGFVAKSGPFDEPKKQMSEYILTQNTGYLELYKKKHGRYPESLEELQKTNQMIFTTDHYLKPFFYQVSSDGQSYILKSLGPDGVLNTPDDIVPKAE
jgi:hypothetical protein